MAGLGKQGQCSCKKADEACMLLCRVTLGDPFIEIQFQGNAAGQFWNGRRKEPTKKDGSIYNSVIGESRKNVLGAYLQFREYIVNILLPCFPFFPFLFKKLQIHFIFISFLFRFTNLRKCIRNTRSIIKEFDEIFGAFLFLFFFLFLFSFSFAFHAFHPFHCKYVSLPFILTEQAPEEEKKP